MIVAADFKTHLYAELIEAIDRNDTAVLTAAIDAAKAEARGYLGRYDVDALYAEAGADRDPILLMRLKDIAAWHFINLANANVDLELRKTRYDEAVKWLKEVQRGLVAMDWPMPAEEEAGDNDVIRVSSRPRRETNY